MTPPVNTPLLCALYTVCVHRNNEFIKMISDRGFYSMYFYARIVMSLVYSIQKYATLLNILIQLPLCRLVLEKLKQLLIQKGGAPQVVCFCSATPIFDTITFIFFYLKRKSDVKNVFQNFSF